jgi:tRNA A-37 threonylcarbamoyl transferase component Bud32
VATDRSFGRYRVTGTLGAGAMGEVYSAVDEVLGREVAVKTLHGNASGLAARLLDERFRLEARAIAALHHPGVVQVFDIDLTADPPYLVMERVTGPSLKEWLGRGPLTEYELRALGIQIGRALAAAHAAGVVHRDVKPANILAAGLDTWKLADFGVAHVPDSSLTITGQFVGSPAYAPPEALMRGQLGTPGDVYGLGATLYEAAAGRWPRKEDTSGALFAPLPPLRELVPALPPELAAVIDRAVAIQPEQRPSAAELADAIAGAATVPGVDLIALPAVARGAVRWKPWAIGGAIVLAIAVLASTRGSSSRSLPVAPGAPMAGAPFTGRPGQIRATPPPGMDGKQTRDWGKIIDELERGRFEGARNKLDEFEDKYGQTDETSELRPQLDALGPDVRGPGGHRGKGRKHRGD